MADDLKRVIEAEGEMSVGKLNSDGSVSSDEVNVSPMPNTGYVTYLPSASGEDGKVLGVIGEDIGWIDYEGDREELQRQIDELKVRADSHTNKFDLTEDGLVYLLNDNGERYSGPYGPFAGSGSGSGGGGGNNAEMTFKNTTGWIAKTIALGGDCQVTATWSSIEDNLSTGNGTLRIIVNATQRASLNVEQGAITVDLSDYLDSGSNTIQLRLLDVYGNYRVLNFSVTVVEVKLESSFDPSIVQTGAITFSYTPIGAVSKTVHFILDGASIGTSVVRASGRQQTKVIPQQKHGGHSLRVYFECMINGETIQSNELYYEFISVVEGDKTPIITSSFTTTQVTQYSQIPFSFTVYNPASLTTAITLYVNGTEVSKQTVNRTEQTYQCKANDVGNLVFKISIDGFDVSRSFTVNVQKLDINVQAVTEDLVLYLSAAGRSNNEEPVKRSEWTYNNTKVAFKNFNYESDGWNADEDGSFVRFTGDGRGEISYKPFEKDFRTTGKTITLDFRTSSVLNYDTTIISCMSGNRGFLVTPQKVTFRSEQSEISTQYKEDEHISISFVIEKRSEHRLIYCYINGIMSGVTQYPNDDDFSQTNPVDITIGSNDCTVDLYCVRVYDNDLTREQILTNWVADTQDGATLVERYTRNNIYDDYGKVAINKLPSTLPYMIISAEELPQYKGDKKTVSLQYVDPVHPSRSFTAENVQLDVQGTSSQYYYRKNYKSKFRSGLTTNSGEKVSAYALRPGAIEEKTFCLKADVASSEGANNVELVRLYNNICPYKTPAQQNDARCRQGIDGFPIVIFWDDGNETSFLGKYNFNNDKSDEATFGFTNGDESWEILNNTSSRVLWKSADFSGDDWLKDFEARYPDTDPPYTDPTQLKAFAEFVASTDTTVPGLTDAQKKERLQKFKDQIGNYTELNDAIFYYLFTELFALVDSRAKNAFPTFVGSAVTA